MAEKKKTYSKPELKSHPMELGVYGNYNIQPQVDPGNKPSLADEFDIRAHNEP